MPRNADSLIEEMLVYFDKFCLSDAACSSFYWITWLQKEEIGCIDSDYNFKPDGRSNVCALIADYVKQRPSVIISQNFLADINFLLDFLQKIFVIKERIFDILKGKAVQQEELSKILDEIARLEAKFAEFGSALSLRGRGLLESHRKLIVIHCNFLRGTIQTLINRMLLIMPCKGLKNAPVEDDLKSVFCLSNGQLFDSTVTIHGICCIGILSLIGYGQGGNDKLLVCKAHDEFLMMFEGGGCDSVLDEVIDAEASNVLDNVLSVFGGIRDGRGDILTAIFLLRVTDGWLCGMPNTRNKLQDVLRRLSLHNKVIAQKLLLRLPPPYSTHHMAEADSSSDAPAASSSVTIKPAEEQDKSKKEEPQKSDTAPPQGEARHEEKKKKKKKKKKLGASHEKDKLEGDKKSSSLDSSVKLDEHKSSSSSQAVLPSETEHLPAAAAEPETTSTSPSAAQNNLLIKEHIDEAPLPTLPLPQLLQQDKKSSLSCSAALFQLSAPAPVPLACEVPPVSSSVSSLQDQDISCQVIKTSQLSEIYLNPRNIHNIHIYRDTVDTLLWAMSFVKILKVYCPELQSFFVSGGYARNILFMCSGFEKQAVFPYDLDLVIYSSGTCVPQNLCAKLVSYGFIFNQYTGVYTLYPDSSSIVPIAYPVDVRLVCMDQFIAPICCLELSTLRIEILADGESIACPKIGKDKNLLQFIFYCDNPLPSHITKAAMFEQAAASNPKEILRYLYFLQIYGPILYGAAKDLFKLTFSEIMYNGAAIGKLLNFGELMPFFKKFIMSGRAVDFVRGTTGNCCPFVRDAFFAIIAPIFSEFCSVFTLAIFNMSAIKSFIINRLGELDIYYNSYNNFNEISYIALLVLPSFFKSTVVEKNIVLQCQYPNYEQLRDAAFTFLAKSSYSIVLKNYRKGKGILQISESLAFFVCDQYCWYDVFKNQKSCQLIQSLSSSPTASENYAVVNPFHPALSIANAAYPQSCAAAPSSAVWGLSMHQPSYVEADASSELYSSDAPVPK